jgi:hypothetical protein
MPEGLRLHLERRTPVVPEQTEPGQTEPLVRAAE